MKPEAESELDSRITEHLRAQHTVNALGQVSVGQHTTDGRTKWLLSGFSRIDVKKLLQEIQYVYGDDATLAYSTSPTTGSSDLHVSALTTPKRDPRWVLAIRCFLWLVWALLIVVPLTYTYFSCRTHGCSIWLLCWWVWQPGAAWFQPARHPVSFSNEWIELTD